MLPSYQGYNAIYLYLFLEFMQNYPSPSNDFVKIVVSLEKQLDEESFTELFVRVCAHPKIDDIIASQGNIKCALNFLIEKKKDSNAACGLLRIMRRSVINIIY